MTVAQAAKMLGHHQTSRVYALIKAKRLEAKTVDGAIEVDEGSVQEYRDTRKARHSTKARTKVRSVPKPRTRKSKETEEATA